MNVLQRTMLKRKRRAQTRRRHKGEAGFSILETCIALVLMCISALGAASLFYFAIQNTVSAGDRDLAMAVAQQKMEQLRNLDFADAGLTAVAGTTPVTITRAGRQYQLYTTIVDSNVVNGAATTKTMTVRAVPVSDTSSWSRTISSYFGAVVLVDQRSALSLGPNRN